jgi:hypothetical protein
MSGYGTPPPGYGAQAYAQQPWGRPRRRRGGGILVFLLVLLIVAGTAGATVFGLWKGGVLFAPDALSADGLDGLRAAVEDETGGTEVFRAVIYPDYAVVDVPADGTSQRQESLRWNGGLDGFGSKGTASGQRVDLAEVDARVMLEAIEEAKTLVDDPETWYAIIEGPGAGYEGGPSISAHASNDFNESGYVRVDLDGTEITRYADGEVITP